MALCFESTLQGTEGPFGCESLKTLSKSTLSVKLGSSMHEHFVTHKPHSTHKTEHRITVSKFVLQYQGMGLDNQCATSRGWRSPPTAQSVLTQIQKGEDLLFIHHLTRPRDVARSLFISCMRPRTTKAHETSLLLAQSLRGYLAPKCFSITESADLYMFPMTTWKNKIKQIANAAWSPFSQILTVEPGWCEYRIFRCIRYTFFPNCSVVSLIY